MHLPSVNSVCIVICKQVDVSLLPAEPMLSWKEKRAVKASRSASADAVQCKMTLAQPVSAAQREGLPFNLCC